MKIKTLQEILKNKSLKREFAVLTNLKNGDSEIFLPNQNFFSTKTNIARLLQETVFTGAFQHTTPNQQTLALFVKSTQIFPYVFFSPTIPEKYICAKINYI